MKGHTATERMFVLLSEFFLSFLRCFERCVASSCSILFDGKDGKETVTDVFENFAAAMFDRRYETVIVCIEHVDDFVAGTLIAEGGKIHEGRQP